MCGATKTEAIPETGHDLKHVEAKVATCTEVGNIEYWTCSVCKKYFKDQNATEEIQQKDIKIEKLEHNYKEGICTLCGEGIFVKSSNYIVQDKSIIGISLETKKEAFLENIKEDFKIIITKGNTEITSEKIGTGMKIIISKDDNLIGNYNAIILGDCNGDGKSDIKDMVKINNYRLYGTTNDFDELYQKASDTNKDGKIDIKDIVRINNYRLYGTKFE